MPRKYWFLLALCALLIVPFSSLAAQQPPTISIAVSAFLRNNFDEGIFDDFEARHGVQVYVNYVNSDTYNSGDIEAYLDAIAEYASAADVLTVSQDELTRFATLAGYFLDISPLANADNSLDVNDFFPAAWASVQWDNAVWALPSSLDATMLIYDEQPFNQAGMSYPTTGWMLDDLLSAARELAQYDSNSALVMPGLGMYGSVPTLFRSLYGQDFFDESDSPRLADPVLEDMLNKWLEYQNESQTGSSVVIGTGQPPIRIMGSFGLGLPRQPNEQPPVAIPLPGGSIGLTLNGLAISSGTTQPELAYELAKYLTFNTEFANSPFTGMSARKSIATEQSLAQGSSGSDDVSVTVGGGRALAISGSSPESKAQVISLMPSALSLVDMTFSSYVTLALQAMEQDNLDAHTALLEAEAQAAADLQTASERRSSVSVIVATPPPPVVLQPGEVEIKFGLQSFIQPTLNLAQWQQMAADFTALDPTVGAVTIDDNFGNAAEFAERDDCFYLSSNAVPGLDSTTVMSLDPFLDADPNFNRNDVVGGLMSQLMKEDRTWAYPLTIQPTALNLNSDVFAQAGVPLPDSSWTVEQFVDTLQSLTSYLGKPAVVPRDINGETLMMLIAAYGGLPVDYRTSPATLNFTDPAAIDAIRQVLDLAKAGYIDYQELAGGGGFRMVTISASTADPEAITSDSLGGFRRIIGGRSAQEDPSRLVTYPTGIFNGASFSIGTGYISVNAENPEACYRWLSYVAEHIDVFSMMPARISQINDPVLQVSFGNNADFYRAYSSVLATPNTVVFPSANAGFNSIGDFITQYWLNRAFDNYVLRGGDLETDLADAQRFATEFQQCVAQLPPSDPTPGALGFNAGILECATTADPSAADLFGLPPS